MANWYFIEEMNESKARNYLLNRLYYARTSNNVIGGYEGWLTALDLYYAGAWQELLDFIGSCHGKCGTRRKEIIACVQVIISSQ